MGIKIGEKPAENVLSNPLGLLYNCHRRVEYFIGVLLSVSEAAEGGVLNDGQQHALKSALRYFREAGPKHTEDEEDSLFPRMQQIQNPKIEAVLDKIEMLKQGHRDAEDDHQRIDQWVQGWLDQGILSAETLQTLLVCLKRLSVFYQAHIQIEETEIFPLAEKWLNVSEIEHIGREMAVRRGLDPDALQQLTEALKKPASST